MTKRKILISPGYGAGWSTWVNDDQEEFMLFDEGLISLVEEKASIEVVEQYVKEKLGVEYICLLGYGQLEVRELEVGTPFQVGEYDGSEVLVVYNREDYHIA